MKPKRIILVRHGESLGNAEPGHYQTTPDYALYLTETGHAQAHDAGAQIAELINNETMRAYISPWYRTRETFADIASVLGERVVRAVEDTQTRDARWAPT